MNIMYIVTNISYLIWCAGTIIMNQACLEVCWSLCFSCRWFFNLLKTGKPFPQCSHTCGYFPVCQYWWYFNACWKRNDLLQTSQINFFSLECFASSCDFNLATKGKPVPQSLQIHGYFPECLYWWYFKRVGVEYNLLHTSQINFLQCTLRWSFNLGEEGKPRPQCSQWCGYTRVCL